MVQYIQYGLDSISYLSSMVQYGPVYLVSASISNMSGMVHYILYVQYGPIYSALTTMSTMAQSGISTVVHYIQDGPLYPHDPVYLVWSSMPIISSTVHYIQYGPVCPICLVWSSKRNSYVKATDYIAATLPQCSWRIQVLCCILWYNFSLRF